MARKTLTGCPAIGVQVFARARRPNPRRGASTKARSLSAMAGRRDRAGASARGRSGVGADQARRVHRARRHRRRRRPDGAPPAGRGRQEQPDEAAADRRQQVGRRGRRRLPRREGREGRSAQDHHHAVEPVHDAARHRRAVQLEGPDAGRDARARPVRAVGQRRDAVQDREGLHRRGEGRRPEQVQDGAAPAPSRKTRSSRSRSRRRPARSSRTSRSRAAATSRCSSSASTSTRR